MSVAESTEIFLPIFHGCLIAFLGFVFFICLKFLFKKGPPEAAGKSFYT